MNIWTAGRIFHLKPAKGSLMRKERRKALKAYYANLAKAKGKPGLTQNAPIQRGDQGHERPKTDNEGNIIRLK